MHQDCSFSHGCLGQSKEKEEIPTGKRKYRQTPDAVTAHVTQVHVADAAVQAQVDDDKYQEQVV